MLLCPSAFTLLTVALYPCPSLYNSNILLTVIASFSFITNLVSFLFFPSLGISTMSYPRTLPPFHLPSLARAIIPIFTFSAIVPLSNSPIAPIMLSCNLPAGVSVSKLSVKERNAILFLSNVSTMLSMSINFLLILFSFQTITKSNLPALASCKSSLSPGRPEIFLPLIPLSS